MYEFEDIHNPDLTAQGDVIEWVQPHIDPPWRTYGVVVTADCDLIWSKHGGMVSYVPAMVAEDYIWHAWRPTHFAKHEPKLLAETTKRLNTWRSKNGMPSALSATAVRAWLGRVGSEGLLNELGVTDKGQRNALLSHLDKVVAIMAALECERPDLPLLRRAHEATNANSASDPQLISQDIQQSWNKLPGDVFHLPSVPTGDERGLFLLLRHVRQLPAEDITGRPAAVREGQAKAKRIARVCAPYRYAITQSLARVFADIGLPAEHDERKKSAASRLFDTWS
jgi:hypothetical protein